MKDTDKPKDIILYCRRGFIPYFSSLQTPFTLGVCARILSRYDRSDDTENLNIRIGD